MTEARARLWKVDLTAIVVMIAMSIVWLIAWPPTPQYEYLDIAMEASYFVGAVLGYLFIESLGHRTLTFGWLVFTSSLLLELLDEFTLEPVFWNETFTFIVGLPGMILIGVGFYRVARRRANEAAEKRQALEQLEAGHSTLRAVLEGTPDLVAVRDLEGRYIVVNSAFARAVGRPVEDIVGRSIADLFPSEVSAALSDRDRRVLETGETVTFEESLPGDTQQRTFLVTKGVYRDHRGFALGILRIARDISDRKKAEARLAHDALHDGLTGLPNRSRFHDELVLAISRQKRKPNHMFGVLFLDLDRFKVINDSLGHVAGDQRGIL